MLRKRQYAVIMYQAYIVPTQKDTTAQISFSRETRMKKPHKSRGVIGMESLAFNFPAQNFFLQMFADSVGRTMKAICTRIAGEVIYD